MQTDSPSVMQQVKLWRGTIHERIDPPLCEAIKRHDLEGAGKWMERRAFAHDRFVTTF